MPSFLTPSTRSTASPHTSRHFAAYADRHRLPFLTVRAGTLPSTSSSLELSRSRAAIGLEKDLFFDPLFPRHLRRMNQAVRSFRTDLIHITGPSELGIAGAWFAWRHRLPRVASWHTNLHEYAARRLRRVARRLPSTLLRRLEATTGNLTLDATTRFYRLARVLFAPNPELCALLENKCHRPCALMQRGVDTALFSPHDHTRPRDPPELHLGFVGRLSIEKNVLLLPRLPADLRDRGITNTRFVVVGHGVLDADLRSALPDAILPGVLREDALARAYANLDLFVFPSHTDTFGNVVLEALASGVPALVTPTGGPRYILASAPAEVGCICSDAEFAPTIAALLAAPERRRAMAAAARDYALTCSWDSVFTRVYAAYDAMLGTSPQLSSVHPS